MHRHSEPMAVEAQRKPAEHRVSGRLKSACVGCPPCPCPHGLPPASLRQHCRLACVADTRRCNGRGLSYPREQLRHSRTRRLPAWRVWRAVGWKQS